ncbi:MAG: response regulator [Desulfuromonadales bacterium]
MKLPLGRQLTASAQIERPAGTMRRDVVFSDFSYVDEGGALNGSRKGAVMGSGEGAGRERIRLVLADDSRLLLDMEKSFFPETEFEVFLAHNGCEAYNLVKTIEPEVVFLDLFMPLINGEECCRLIKSDLHLHATRVVLVAPDEEQQLQRCYGAQCDQVVTKPIRRRNFIAAVQALVGQLPRVPARWPVRVAAELYDGDRCCLQSWTVNLSEKGAYLEGGEMCPMGRNYTLLLKPAGNEPLSIPARITWLNPGDAPRDRNLPSGFGLQFYDLTSEIRALLRKLLGETADPDNAFRDNQRAPTRMFVELPMLTGKKP